MACSFLAVEWLNTTSRNWWSHGCITSITSMPSMLQSRVHLIFFAVALSSLSMPKVWELECQCQSDEMSFFWNWLHNLKNNWTAAARGILMYLWILHIFAIFAWRILMSICILRVPPKKYADETDWLKILSKLNFALFFARTFAKKNTKKQINAIPLQPLP